jgi:hypothetical protein
MRKFLINIFRFASIGIFALLVLLLGYIIYDPFKVIYTYNDYSYSYVYPNRDYVSTEIFLKNKYNYNSFIFGSSRTHAFLPSSWKNYLTKDAKPFTFDASAESIHGIYSKIKYLDSIHASIDNVLLVFCRDVTFSHSPKHTGYLFLKDPKISKESNLDFQFAFFKAYLTPKFILSFYEYTFTKKFRPYMSEFIEPRKITIDKITNEMNLVDTADEINNNPVGYYEKRKNIFYERAGEQIDSLIRINEIHLFMLKEIKRILEKNKTNYYVVLSPLYEQKKFSNSDFNTLKILFGKRLYDFSGKNTFTNNKINYYETSHFRRNVGDSILKIIYE